MEIYFIDQSSVFKDVKFVAQHTRSKKYKRLMYSILNSRLTQAVQFLQQKLIAEPNDKEYLNEKNKI